VIEANFAIFAYIATMLSVVMALSLSQAVCL
jgi:hypothetical protein